jgi:sporulation protein YlmC with PRC-barrel domain
MFRSIKDIQGYKIVAEDGELGKVAEFYFDDELWLVRYLVVETGSWLLERKVLIAPVALKQPNDEAQALPVKLTTEQVKYSPDIETDQPVSRQHEIALHEHYAWPYIDRLGGGLFQEENFGMRSDSVVEMIRANEQSVKLNGEPEPQKQAYDPHLQSSKEIIGYHIHAHDGKIGHVEDFILNDDTWAIRYMIVDTGSWLPGRKVLISPFWINDIEWAGSIAHVDLIQETIKNSPEYDPSEPIQRDYENKLFEHYDWPKYWL